MIMCSDLEYGYWHQTVRVWHPFLYKTVGRL